jgi:hypothetical protein
MSRPDLSFTQVATGDLDVAIVGQLPAANLSLGDKFEPSPVNVIAFDAPFWRWGLGEQNLEDAPGNADHALILAARTNTHSITSSAIEVIKGGIVKPSAFAVFPLIKNSNLVGCSTGKSDGLAPFRILAT